MENVNIAIIGGGTSGIIALYECKMRNIKATLYEKESSIGGVWNLDASNKHAHKSTVFNTSSFLSSYNVDFSLFKYLEEKYSEKSIDYAPSTDYNSYLFGFIEYYRLNSMILLNRIITDIIPGESVTKFRIKAMNLLSKQEETYNHNYVIVSSGRFMSPIIPDESFLSRDLQFNDGKIWHTGHWDPLNNASPTSKLLEKDSIQVLVIGSGPSASEAIQDTLTKTKGATQNLKIFWAPTRNPDKRSVWMLDHYPYSGRKAASPLDESFCRLANYVPAWLINRMITKIAVNVLRHQKNAIPDTMRDQYCIVNQKNISKAIQSGIIEIISDPIKKIYKSGSSEIQFDTARAVSMSVDVVIIGTGYTPSDIKINGQSIASDCRYYRQIIPVEESYHGRIGFICRRMIIGSAIPIGQMEIKWLLYQWFDQQNILPKILDQCRTQKTYAGLKNSKYYPGLIFDELAKDMKVMPTIWKNLISIHSRQRHLSLSYLLGPWSIYQYSTIAESASEQRKRENVILLATEKSFKKTGVDFRLICLTSDLFYVLSILTIAYFTFNLCRDRL